MAERYGHHPVPEKGLQKDGSYVGQGTKSVTEAIVNAYNGLKPKYSGKASFHIDDIWVVGTNPISEYVVKISNVPNG